jgi:hypothetical protein
MLPNWINPILCHILGHRYRFRRITLEGDRLFICKRCGRDVCTPG